VLDIDSSCSSPFLIFLFIGLPLSALWVLFNRIERSLRILFSTFKLKKLDDATTRKNKMMKGMIKKLNREADRSNGRATLIIPLLKSF